MNRLQATFLLIMVGHLGQSQSLQVENYSIQQGMPSVEVYHIYQDSKGFIWFATDNGVVRFDGSELKTYHVKQGLPDPVIFSFFEDYKGRIWFRSYSGNLAYLENDQIKPFAFNTTITSILKNNIIHSIYYDKNNVLWLSAGNEIVQIRQDGTVSREPMGNHRLFVRRFDSGIVHGLFGPQTVDSINIDGKLFQLPLENPNFRTIQSLTWNNKLLISISRDLFSFDGQHFQKVLTSKSTIISLSTDKHNNVWIGYLNGGVERLPARGEESRSLELLANLSVTTVLEDHEGGMWFSTLENGVFYFPKQAIQLHTLPSKTPIKTVSKNAGKIIAGDAVGNYFIIDPLSKKIESMNSLGSPIIAMFAKTNGNHLISTSMNVFELDPNNNPFTVQLEPKVDFSESPNGVIWSVGGSRGSHVTRIDNRKTTQYTNLKDTYRTISADESNIYLAGRTGLDIYTKEMEFILTHPQLTNFKITDITNINDTTLLLATSGSGFALMNKKTKAITRYDTENKLLANSVYAVLIKNTSLWLATEMGVIKTEISGLLAKSPKFYYLTKKSGLASDKINCLIDYSSEIWAFSENYISIIPDTIQNFINENPRFYLKKLTFNQASVDVEATPQLSFDQNDITISFGFISFNNNKNITTRFRLSSKDPWIKAESRELQFFSLSPGTYNLTLEYSIDNNEWKTAISDLSFHILPPWWKAWYYQLLMAVIITMIGLLYLRTRLLASRQKQEYLALINNQQQKLLQTEIQSIERERSRIAKDLHDTVGTNLAAIKMMVSQLLHKHHEPLAENVENQLQDVIKETKELIYNLVPPGLERFGLFIIIRNHIAKLNHSTQTQIDLSTSGNDIFNADRNIIIFRIIQELLSNSLKHAHASTIAIAVNTFEDHVNILYEDNGIGFSDRNSKAGFGLLNIQSRIESLQGDIKFESGYSGTAYTLNIPYPSQHDQDRTGR